MHVLLTNDDGIDAPGLAALERAFADKARITIAAPHEGYSGCGHQVTYRSDLQVEQVAERRFKVFGTPADCARVGLTALVQDVDVVLSGINEGGNMGVDVYMSGTVAAVREAVWLGTPGIAFSQYFRVERERDWEKASQMALRAFDLIQRQKTNDERAYWNVNLPDVDTPVEELELVDTFVEPNHMPIAYEHVEGSTYVLRTDYRNRKRTTGSDVEVCMGSGLISISRVLSTP